MIACVVSLSLILTPLLATPGSALADPAALASSQAKTYIAECSTAVGEVAPRMWSSGCVAGSANFSNLTWSNWAMEGATATGTSMVTDCDPNCLGGEHAEFRSRLTALHLRRCKAEPGNSQYLAVKTETYFPADNVFGHPPGWDSETWTVKASNCTALIAVPEQGVGIILEERPKSLAARRNVDFPAFSGSDAWVVSKWLKFGGPRAVGRATYWWHTPDGSHFRHYKSRVVLHRLRSCGKLHIYTRITGRFIGRKPPHMHRKITQTPPPAETC